MSVNIGQTIDLLKGALGAPNAALGADLAKAFTQGTGLVAYDLEAPAKSLINVLTPLRNRIPRVGGGIGTATNWKMITAVSLGSASAGVSEGNRGSVIATTVVDKAVSYKGIGLEDYVTFEAEDAGQGFQDVTRRPRSTCSTR
jgi:hypothetical protein